jgi:hypothetical protein
MTIQQITDKLNPERAIVFLISTAFVVYIALRARFVPVTIDEVSTLLNHSVRGIWDIVTYEREATPNNHIFHTLLLKLTSEWLGYHIVPLRLPALMGGLLYLWAARGIASLGAAAWLRLAALLVLLGNHFVVEFLSLARGYGLGSAFMLASIYFALRYRLSARLPHIGGSIGCAFLAVWSNFTLLNYFVPFMLLLPVWNFQQQRAHWLRDMALWAAGLVITFLAAYKPIKAMRVNDEFKYWATEGFVHDTVRPFLRNALDISSPHIELFLVWVPKLVIAFCMLGWTWGIGLWLRNRGRFEAYTFVAAVFLGTVMYNLVQGYWLKVPFLDARTSLLFYPLLALLLIAVGHWFWQIKKIAAYAYMAVVLWFAAYNFWGKINLDRQTEWWFDNGTFVVLDYLEELYFREKRSEAITLDTSWPMQNSFLFHTRDSSPRRDQYVKVSGWHGNREFPRDTEFYYSEVGDDVQKLQPDYEVVLEVPQALGRLFRKRK